MSAYYAVNTMFMIMYKLYLYMNMHIHQRTCMIVPTTTPTFGRAC